VKVHTASRSDAHASRSANVAGGRHPDGSDLISFTITKEAVGEAEFSAAATDATILTWS
jgi:hypothetical protein